MPKTLKQHAVDIANAFTRWGLWQGGGASALANLTDVNLSDLQNNSILNYDISISKWKNIMLDFVGVNKNYTSQEKIIGTWTDGKPLYQISIVGTASGTNATEINTNFNCAGKNLKKVNLTIENNNYSGYTQNSGNYYVNNNNLVVLQTLTGSNIVFRYNIIVEYTKQSDSTAIPVANVLHEYTTNEQIVGKWIDGKNLYEKTYTFNISGNYDFTIDVPFDYLDFNFILNDGVYRLKEYYYSDSNRVQAYIENSTNRIRFINTHSGIIYLTIRYTKTTE